MCIQVELGMQELDSDKVSVNSVQVRVAAEVSIPDSKHATSA